jgi:Mg-chelatase subunit ChlD
MSLVDFGAIFVNEARKAVDEVPGIKKTAFTSRQSQAIVSLGISKLLRLQEELGADDLVNLAVITTPPEAQKYSEMIALRILFGDVRDVVTPSFDIPTADGLQDPDQDMDPQMKAQHLLMNEVLKFLELQKSVDLSKGLEEYRFAEFAEEEIYSSDPSKYDNFQYDEKLDLARKRTAYNQIGGRSGILQSHLSNWDQVFDTAKNSIRKSVPHIDNSGMINSEFLDVNQDVRDLSREQSIKNLSELFEGIKQPEEADMSHYEDIMDNMTQREIFNSLQAMNELESQLRRMGLEQSKFAPSLQKIQDYLGDKFREDASTLDDVLNQPNLFDEHLSRENLEEFVENSMKYNSPMEMLEKAKQIDDLFGTNLSSYILDKFEEQFKELDIEDFVENPISSAEWFDSFNQKLDEFKEDESLNWEDQKRMAEDLLDLKDKVGNEFISNQLEEELEHFVDRMISSATTPEQLTESVEFARDYNIPFNPQKVKKKGHEVGMSNEEIARLLGGAFEYVKSMIENQEATFEKTHVILDKANLPQQQIQQLIDLSIEQDAEGALGALAAVDLRQVTDSIPNTPEGRELLEKALGAGGGENLLYQWFQHANRMPHWLRQIVKDHAKRIMIDLAKKKAASLIGSSEAGPLPEGSTRPYFLGDDLDTIDLDETIDNILDQGKQIDDVRVDDFIVRKTITGRRCVIFLVDISGSMSGPPLASASIATAMLLITFARDELGVALFESDTHVLCEIDEYVDIDEIVDEILDLEARGGTQMSAALEWAKKQFELSRSEDKMFVMVSDAGLGDFNRCQPHLEKIADMGATSTLILPHSGFGMGNIQSILNAAQAELITVKDWKNFPEIVSEILSRV